MSFCVYSYGSNYKDWGLVRRYDMLLNENKMVIGGDKKDFEVLKKCKYFIPYKSKKLFGTEGEVFEDIYEIDGEPIKVDTVDKWKLCFNNGNRYYDDIPNKPSECIEHFKEFIRVKGNMDIVWFVKKVKSFRKKTKELPSLPYRLRYCKITELNSNFPEIVRILNSDIP